MQSNVQVTAVQLDQYGHPQQRNLNSIVDNKVNDYGKERQCANNSDNNRCNGNNMNLLSHREGLVVLANLNSNQNTSDNGNISANDAISGDGSNNTATNVHHSTPIYRDFVSLQADNNSFMDTNNSGAHGATAITTLDPTTITNGFESNFLCQPNHVSILNNINTDYITGQGNVQLMAPVATTATSSAYTNLVYPCFVNDSHQVQYSPFHISLTLAKNMTPSSIGSTPTMFIETGFNQNLYNEVRLEVSQPNYPLQTISKLNNKFHYQ